MRIALTAEGTYPHQFGGVSVWCDQLVRGLPEYDFGLVALVATGTEPVRWELPGNVTGLSVLPLWGSPPPAGRGSRWLRARSGPPVAELIEVLLAPPDEAQDRFAAVLRELFDYAQQENLSAELASEQSVRLLSEAWRRHWRLDQPPPTLQDAVTAIQLLEHALRPLAHPPPQADVAHAVTNGLGALPALAAKWRYGTPIVVTEHGMYMQAALPAVPAPAVRARLLRGDRDHAGERLQQALGSAAGRGREQDPHRLQRGQPGRLPGPGG
jgi:hypothetical protein